MRDGKEGYRRLCKLLTYTETKKEISVLLNRKTNYYYIYYSFIESLP